MRGLIVASLVLALAVLAAPTAASWCQGSLGDYSSLTYSDYIYQNVGGNNDTYYFRPCSNVTAVACASRPSMLCQQDPFGNIYDLAFWYGDISIAGTTWMPVMINGVQGERMTIANGDMCGSTPRVLNVNFLCQANLGAQQAIFTNVVEDPICTYTITVYNSVVCTTTTTQTCGAYGYDLTSLTTADLSYVDNANNYTYWYRPCGTVTSTQCAQNPSGGVAGEAMLCQAVGTHNEISDAYDIAVWNPSLASWARFGGGGNNPTGAGRTLQMTISDGASCGGVPRTLQVNYVCTPSASSPVFWSLMEVATCNYVAYINTTTVCQQPQTVTTPQACGGQYNLNQLSTRDLTYSSSGYNFIFRPCSTVSDIQCANNPAANSSMLCQAVQNSNTAYSLALWDSSQVSWVPTLQGIKMTMQDGTFCAAANINRRIEIHFICRPGGGQNNAQFLNLTEISTCTYVGYVGTNLVCPGPNVGGYCGAQGYDFSLASSSNDYVYVGSGYRWYFRPCSTVIAPVCAQNSETQVSMMCQNQIGSTSGYDIAFYDSNLVYWNRISNGMQMFVQDGTTCGSLDVPRSLTMNFICSAGPVATFANITETSLCAYTGYILTPQACSVTSSTGTQNLASTGVPGDYTDVTHCGGPYDLTSLSNSDLMLDDKATNYTWVLRPCGMVSYSPCLANTATNTAMMCQVRDQDQGAYEVATYMPAYVQYNPIRNGLNMSIQDGQLCGLTPRALTITFTCDTSATTASLVSVREISTCQYVARVVTNLVCPRAASTCGGAGYDLSLLTTRGDLYLPNDGGGNQWYFAPCSVVQAPICTNQSVTSASMMCQVNSFGSSYDIAVYVPQAITWTAIDSGVRMQIQDGQTCGDFERRLTVNFLCGGGFYQFINVSELQICDYVAFINTGSACNQLQIDGSSSSSSSLSGGAIAGIVIGVVIGALIILAVILVICCGVGGFALAKKSSSTDDGPKASGRFDQMEASEVEMNDTHANDAEGEETA